MTLKRYYKLSNSDSVPLYEAPWGYHMKCLKKDIGKSESHNWVSLLLTTAHSAPQRTFYRRSYGALSSQEGKCAVVRCSKAKSLIMRDNATAHIAYRGEHAGFWLRHRAPIGAVASWNAVVGRTLRCKARTAI